MIQTVVRYGGFRHPLRAIRKIVDEILAGMSKRFDALYVEEGRPSIPPERLLWALLLQMFYTDADGATGLEPVVPLVCGAGDGRRRVEISLVGLRLLRAPSFLLLPGRSQLAFAGDEVVSTRVPRK